jgi:hypothetical protein
MDETKISAEDRFLRDVAGHEMSVLLDNGIYRHLRFANADSSLAWNQWFEIVTWPGFLAYSGDMGCFIFSRLKDMFMFFRTDQREDGRLCINRSYWAEKLQAVDRCGRRSGAEEFSSAKLQEHVDATVAEWVDAFNLSAEERQELREELDEQVIGAADDGEDEVRRALRDFSFEVRGRRFEFQDSWEWHLQDYTPRFTWCCYALAWAIKQYDARAAGHVPQAVADAGLR